METLCQPARSNYRTHKSAGLEFEEMILGKCSASSYADFRTCRQEAIRVCIEEGWDAEQPPKHLPIRQMLDAVRDELAKRNMTCVVVSVWRSVGTSLDHIHSVDGFFSARIVTLEYCSLRSANYNFDLSLYTYKKKKRGRHILRKSNFQDKLQGTAKKIANILQRQLEDIKKEIDGN